MTSRNPTDGTAGGRGNLPTPGGKFTGLDPTSSDCPDSCCSTVNENCFRTLDNTGYSVDIEEEIMLVFGGMTYRNLSVNGSLLYETCESANLTNSGLAASYFSCGEELLNDLWRYHISKSVFLSS